LALRLRTDVIDSEIRTNARLANMQAWAAIHGRHDTELSDVGASLRKIYFDALAAMPYLTGGQSYDSSGDIDADNLAAQFKEWQAEQAKHKGFSA